MNSKALPFLIIAGIVLAGAVIWKLTNNPSETKETVSYAATENVVSNSKETEDQLDENKITAQDIIVDEIDQLKSSNIQELSIEEREELRDNAKNYMQFSMKYTTAEKAISALSQFKKSGNEEMVNSLLSFIKQSYPEAKIPKDLLD